VIFLATPEARAEYEKWGRVVRETGATVN